MISVSFSSITLISVLEIRDSQNLAKLGLGGKPTRIVASNEEIKRFLNIATILIE